MKASFMLICGLAGLMVSPNLSAQSIPSDAPIFQRPSSVASDKTFQHSTEFSSLAQINSVSSLSDVQPTDWAYEALRSLVERYGCIVGYPDQTYRGNRAF